MSHHRRVFPLSQPATVCLLVLLGVTSMGLAFDDYSRTHRAKAMGSHPETDAPLLPFVYPTSHYLTLLVEFRHTAPVTVKNGGDGSPIFQGANSPLRIVPMPPRPSKLADPVAVLGGAYLECRAIQAKVLEPRVPVDCYPAGYFDDWVHEGVLITERVEFPDEPGMKQVFALLAEGIGEAEEEDGDWIYNPWDAPGQPTIDFHRKVGFCPDLAVEFDGRVPFRVELSLAQERVFIRAGDKWDVYALDRLCAQALRELLAAPRSAKPDHSAD